MPRWNATKHSGNEMICVIGHQNFAHYASNQLPAVALLPRLGVGGNVTLLETYRPLGAIRSLFPELDLEVTQVAAGALENVNKPGLLIVPLGSLRLTKDIRDRVLRHAEARLGPQTISIIKKVNRTQPCLWVSVRTVNRTASNQHELLLALCRRFLREYGAAHVIIDGHSLPADFALDEGAADSRDVVAADLAVARAIKQELDVDGEQERVHLAVGLSILETLFLGHLANFYFCHYGTIQHKIGWFHSCAGVIHSNSALLEAAYPVALRSEVAVPPVYLPPETVVDESPDTSGDERQLALKHNGYFVHVHAAVNFVMNTYRKAMAARPNYLRRDQVIQSYLDLFDHANYLEIGVFSGDTFHAVRAAAKVAVDPRFRIDPEDREAGATYCEITSNEYFAELPAHVHSLFHVIFLDGLHTFEQTLRDLLNAIQILRQGGVIVIDDVWPNSYPASLTDWQEIAAVKEATGVSDQFWMGDVYRLVYFIQSFLPRFRYATCENNHGQLVMWRASRGPEPLPERRIEDIARMEFRHIVTQRDVFNFLPNAEIVRRVRESMPPGGRDEASLLMPRGE